MGQSSSKKYVVQDEIDDSFVDVGVDTPFTDWMYDLRKWVELDSKPKMRKKMISMIDEDINNKVHHDHVTFWDRYSGFGKGFGTLGKAALEVTRANFMLWDFGNAPTSNTHLCV